MSNRVRWQEVDRETYEDMVAVLISRLHPKAQRIDGSGGDGGRDVQVPLEGGLEIFQLKSQTGRMGKSQRAQVRNSLKGAALHNPVAWHLVVPINPTPAELTWFENLTANCPFPCDWHGKTWLDMHMSQMPEIYRYYLDGASEEVIELIERLQLENTALGDGVPGAIERFRAIQDEINETDPHYLFYLSSQPDGNVAVSVHRRYPGAEKDRPIYVRPQFAFSDTPEGRQAQQDLQRSLDFGTPSTIPSEFVRQVALDLPAGLGGEFSGGPLTLGGSTDEDLPELTIFLQVRDNDEHVVTQLPLNILDRSSGRRGAILTFTDTSEAVTATLQSYTNEGRYDFNYRFQQSDEYNPFTLLPAVKLVASLEPGFQMMIVIDGRVAGGGDPRTSTEYVQEAKGFAYLLEDLTYLQSRTGIYFDIQRNLTTEELEAMETGVRLLRGETLRGTWNSLNIDITREGYAMIQDTGLAGPNQFRVVRHMSVVIHDFQIPIGQVVYEVPSAALSTHEIDLTQDAAESFNVAFAPADSNVMSWWLQTSEDDQVA